MNGLLAYIRVTVMLSTAVALGPAPVPAQDLIPCDADPRYREFDFWIGEWDVYVQDRKVGENVIEPVLEGCALLESWTSVRGIRGMSLNFYDPSTGRWRQQWVSQSGGNVWYVGGVDDGVMKLSGQNIQPDGTLHPARVLFIPLSDGRVRQLIEQSVDGGRSWRVWFDGLYVRRETLEGGSRGSGS